MPNGLKKSVNKADDSTTKFIKGLKRTTTEIIYGKGKTATTFVNFSDSQERQQFIKGIKNIRNNPGIVPITSTIKVFNTYNVCSPLQFLATQAFPPGSKVADGIAKFEGKVGDLLNLFKKFQFIQGNQNAEGVFGIPDPLDPDAPVLIPFQIGNIAVVITSDQPGGDIQAPIHKGSQVIVKQVDDPKVGSKMIGNVLRSFPITSEDVGGLDDSAFGVGYQIEVTSISPAEPPYIKDKNGNTQVDANKDPIPRGFEFFKIEFESDPSATDVRELATELNGLNNAIRELGVEDLRNNVNALPSTIPFIGKLKEPFQVFLNSVDQTSPTLGAVATEAGGVQAALAGGLSAQEVIDRVRVLKDLQNKILPFTNVTSFIEEKFKKEIEDVNNLLVDAIPYDQLAAFVGIIVKFAKFIEGTITMVLALLRTVSQILKTISTILKVLKIVIKVVKAVIKFLPAAFIPVGAIQVITEKLEWVEQALGTAIDFLDKAAKIVDALISSLELIKRFLTVFIKETAKFQEKLDSCNNTPEELTNSLNGALRNSFTALQSLLTVTPNKGVKTFQQSQAVTNLINATDDNVTILTLEDGSLMFLPGSVYGFDGDGNIVFNGKLTSGATGIVFDDARGQDLRDLFAEGNQLQYYTYNKFTDKNRGLLEAAEENFFKIQPKPADPEDRFGNFAEFYLGYTLKIQEERPIDKNSNSLIRRRGIALDSAGKITVATELTFSTDISTIIQELKLQLKRNTNDGTMGINTPDKDSNQIDDDSAIELAKTTGANSLAISNLKAEQSNRAASLPGLKNNNDVTPTEIRTGNEDYIPMAAEGTIPASSTPNPSVKQRPIDTQVLIQEPLNEFIASNPSLAKIQNSYNILSGASSNQISSILSQPGVENLSEAELIATLKESILSEIDPNPDKVNEINRKTTQWYGGLEGKARSDWEILVARSAGTKTTPPPFEEYFETIVEQELPKWIRLLLRQRYTETEVEFGISQEEIREEYRITIDGTKVKVKRKRGRKK